MSAGPFSRRMLIGAAVGLAGAGSLGVALSPALLTYSPLLLVALSPLPRHLLLVAPLTPMTAFVLVASLRRMLGSLLAYGFGHSYGESGLQWVRERYPKLAPLTRGVERFFLRVGPLALLLAPGPMFSALAGVTRMRLGVYASTALAGQVVWAAITYRVGEAMAHWIAPVIDFVRAHVIEATLACVVAIASYRLVRRRKREHDVLRSLDSTETLVSPPAPEEGHGS